MLKVILCVILLYTASVTPKIACNFRKIVDDREIIEINSRSDYREVLGRFASEKWVKKWFKKWAKKWVKKSAKKWVKKLVEK